MILFIQFLLKLDELPKQRKSLVAWRALSVFSDPGGRYKRAVTMQARRRAEAEVADGPLPVAAVGGRVNNMGMVLTCGNADRSSN